MTEPLLLLAAIVVAGMAAQWLAWRLRLPAILFLLALGMIAGPFTEVLDPDALLGDLLFPMVSLAVAVILFEGALTLRFEQIRGLEQVVRNLVTVGALITWLVMAGAAWLLGLPRGLAALFGALVVVTGPTVIVPMLRSVRPTDAVSNALRWEGIVIDPLGALAAVIVFQVLVAGLQADQHSSVWFVFAKTVAVGGVLGLLAGRLLATALKRHLLPEFLHNSVTLAIVLGVYAISDLLAHESGLLAVTVMGMTMANTRDTPLDDILDFKESLSLLLISVLFIVLAARIDLVALSSIFSTSVLLLITLMFVARPLGVFASTLGSRMSARERLLTAWIGPRGIVAAAVSAAFALRLVDAGMEEARVLVPLTFTIILGTVIIQGITATPLARVLGVREPDPRGVLIVGAHALARRLGKALHDLGFAVVLADTSYEAIRESRMMGLRAFFGSPVSEHADRHLDLVGIGRLLALSPSAQLNALACLRYAPEFGRGRVFALQTGEKDSKRSGRAVSGLPGFRVFSEGVGYSELSRRIARGGEIRVTRLTDEFDFEAYLEQYGEDALPLVAVTPDQRLRMFTAEEPLEPGPDWKVVALVLPREDEDGDRTERTMTML